VVKPSGLPLVPVVVLISPAMRRRSAAVRDTKVPTVPVFLLGSLRLSSRPALARLCSSRGKRRLAAAGRRDAAAGVKPRSRICWSLMAAVLVLAETLFIALFVLVSLLLVCRGLFDI
jgi:hypothetical protein